MALQPPVGFLAGEGRLSYVQIQDACSSIAILSFAFPEVNKWKLKNSYEEQLALRRNVDDSHAILSIVWAQYLAEHVIANGDEDNMPFQFEEIETNPRSPFGLDAPRNVTEAASSTVNKMAKYFVYGNNPFARRAIRAVQELASTSQKMVFFCRAFSLAHNQAVDTYFGRGFMGALETWIELEAQHRPNFPLSHALVDAVSPLVNGDWRTSDEILQQIVDAEEEEQ